MAWQANRVLAHIEIHIEMPLRTMELAALVRLSNSYFFHAFKISFWQPPHAYVLCRRVERAKLLMLLPESPPLAEVALKYGLSDQAHLSRVFRKLVGESPSAWRRTYRARPSLQ
jgi:AraC-like DNA-binding protein